MGVMNTLTQLEFNEADFKIAEEMAKRMGYEQTVYTSHSALIGLTCLPENPEYHPNKPHKGGTIIKTKELGLLWVQCNEDLQNHDLHHRETLQWRDSFKA
jgi:hypothetical protein